MFSKKITALAATGLLVCASSPAYAYLDAGTGSILLQALFGGIASAMIFGRAYLAKAKAFFQRSSTSVNDDAK